MGVQVNQADEQEDVREAIDHRVPEPAELADRAELDSYLAVDEVENVCDDHHDAGRHEAAERELPGGGRVDEDLGEGENVRVNPEGNARLDDRAQREHTDPADEPGEGHIADIMEGS